MRALLLIFLCAVIGGKPAFVTAQEVPIETEDMLDRQLPPDHRFFVLVHPDGLPDYPEYASLNLRQEVVSREHGKVTLQITVNRSFPDTDDPFPTQEFDPSFRQYLEPSSSIESDHPEILAIRDQILAEHNPQTQLEAVNAVLRWNRQHLRWGEPVEVQTALEALHTGVVNCIGFTHLPAAILRSMGIPVRTLRTFIGNPARNRIIPHYLTEVYFPGAGGWVTYEPQGPAVPSAENIVAYAHHDWDPAGQAAFRPVSNDPRLRVKGRFGVYQPGEDLTQPQLHNIRFESERLNATSPDDTFRIFFEASDAGSGIQAVHFEYSASSIPRVGGEIWEAASFVREGDVHRGVFEGQLFASNTPVNFNEYWEFTEVILTDKSGNETWYDRAQLREMGLHRIPVTPWDFRAEKRPELVQVVGPFPSVTWLEAPNTQSLMFYITKLPAENSGFMRLQHWFTDGEGPPVALGMHEDGMVRGSYDIRTVMPNWNRPELQRPDQASVRYFLNRVYGRDSMTNSLDVSGAALEQRFGPVYMDVVSQTQPVTAEGPAGIRHITRIGGEAGVSFTGNVYLVVETEGSIKPFDPPLAPAQNMFREPTVRAGVQHNRRVLFRQGRRFGHNVFLLEVNENIRSVEITDASGEVHSFDWETLQDRVTVVSTSE
ncbi:Transglutaminase-like superfamily protein [Cyclonatronum proteinivorum]|uniref:Transglutaminase-like superfamily protein n=1 Tax=Cyclonatronum proteinivorum TaxID=1457365 RepID=A0A345UM15_9BACT|nr:transglutaminase-like domain-containing protein [Cyclonatronum proteinivorum]AXJ01517.1 Transglutaminase-like superfamily protein [Cyclonatronum proteinivorum]